MSIQAKKNLLASVVITALSTISASAYSADTYKVIVKLKNESAPFVIDSKQENALTSQNIRKTHQLQAAQRKMAVKSFVQTNQINAKHIYNHVYHGFAAEVTEKQMDLLKQNPNVEGVYKDINYYISAKEKPQKTTKKKRILIDWPQVIPQGPVDSGSINSSYTGKSQHVYVLDTGIDTRQNDIKDNLGLSYAPQFCHWPSDKKLCPMPFSDDHGHGTHVAGTIAASNNQINAVGVAPEATIHAVKVCSNAGSCPASAILAGLNWSVFDMLGRGEPAVANLSLGGSGSDPGTCTADGYEGTNFVAESYCNATHQGMVIVVAAGNDAENAAEHTPASFDSTITVSSYKSYDTDTGEVVYSWFTNYGTGANDWSARESGVVTIAAPGSSVVSLNRTHATRSMSGTSMATPSVAGAAALIMEKFPQEMDYTAMLNVRQMLVDNATVATAYTTEPDDDGVVVDFPHAEGLLNVRFLEEQ
ncbi:S8 family serine peptidase [Aliikangiella sp. IMCC44359]|uniref:S8 family serine peptidase n=1 Tax=Aliikangiella sp. IMCC44359 TaxID=3459125 RepID=UPI00403B1046